MSDEQTVVNHSSLQAIPEKRFIHHEQRHQEDLRSLAEILDDTRMSNTRLAIMVENLSNEKEALKKELRLERAQNAKLAKVLADCFKAFARIADLARVATTES